MCSYNQINNSYGCQNSKLLNNILKDELGFQGFVMSDWQAQHSGVVSSSICMCNNTVANEDSRRLWQAWICKVHHRLSETRFRGLRDNVLLALLILD